MIILGIDPACGVGKSAAPLGLAVVDTQHDQLLWSQAVQLQGETIEQRAQHAGRMLTSTLALHGTECVAIEAVHMRFNSRTAVELAYVAGALIAATGTMPVVLVQPSQAKQALTALGNATKKDMITMARARGWTLPKRQSDASAIADAAAVALAGTGLWQDKIQKRRDL